MASGGYAGAVVGRALWAGQGNNAPFPWCGLRGGAPGGFLAVGSRAAGGFGVEVLWVAGVVHALPPPAGGPGRAMCARCGRMSASARALEPRPCTQACAGALGAPPWTLRRRGCCGAGVGGHRSRMGVIRFWRARCIAARVLTRVGAARKETCDRLLMFPRVGHRCFRESDSEVPQSGVSMFPEVGPRCSQQSELNVRSSRPPTLGTPVSDFGRPRFPTPGPSGSTLKGFLESKTPVFHGDPNDEWGYYHDGYDDRRRPLKDASLIAKAPWSSICR